MSRRVLVLGAVTVLAGVFACTGGPGAPGDLDSPWSQKPGSTFESAPNTSESPGSSLDPAPAPTDRAPGTGGGGGGGAGGCPPCGTYLCTGTATTTVNGQTSTSTVTVPIPLTKQSDGSCAFIENKDSVVLTCKGTITDQTGKQIGTWSANGSSVTLTASDSNTKSTTCTVSSGSSPRPTPTPTVTVTATPVPPPTASPPVSIDGGF